MPQSIDKRNKIIIYLIFLFILSTTNIKFTENKKDYSPKSNKIDIEGLASLNNSKILDELNVLFYENIFTIRKEVIKEAMNRYNFIEEFSVKKIYPRTIKINIKLTKIIARIANNDQLLVGENGKIIEDKGNTKILPYIFGEFDSKEFLFFKKSIEKSKFSFTEFKTLYFFPSNRWDILTNNNILIKLPQEKFSESLNLAYKILSSNEFKTKELIDLRANNQLIIK